MHQSAVGAVFVFSSSQPFGRQSSHRSTAGTVNNHQQRITNLVINVYTPHGLGGKEPSSASDGRETVESVRGFEHYTCAVGSLVVAVVLAAVLYPLLVSLTWSLGILATTAITSTVVLVWGLGWIGLELLWEWRAGRWQRP